MRALASRRLRAPLVTAGVGAALAVAVLVVAGWAAALPVAVAAALPSAFYYWLGGTDTDVGALIGARPDERQGALVLHALQPAAIAMFLVAAIAGVALSGTTGEVAFRVQAIAFALAVVAGFVLFRPRTGGAS